MVRRPGLEEEVATLCLTVAFESSTFVVVARVVLVIGTEELLVVED